MSQDSSSSPLAWIAGLLLVVLALWFWRFTLMIGGTAVVLGAIAWAAYAMLSKSGRAEAAFDRREFAAGLQLLQQRGKPEALLSALRFKVPFPTDESKEAMVEAVRGLLALQEAAGHPSAVRLPENLREDIVRRTDESLASLWPLCQKLSLLASLARSGKAETVRESIDDLVGQLAALGARVDLTRRQIAGTTVEAPEFELETATEQVAAIGWQVTELRKLDAMLDG